MATVSGLNILFWMIVWGALMGVFELHFHADDGVLGSFARALAVIH